MKSATHYDTPGPYTTGYWLVYNNKGINMDQPFGGQPTGKPGSVAEIVNYGHLPPVGTGWTYYWLGTTKSEVSTRLGDALAALGVNAAPTSNLADLINRAFSQGNSGNLIGPIKAIPNPISIPNPFHAVSSVASVIQSLFNGDLWKGIGLILAGAAILIFAGFEVVKHM